MVTFYLRFVNDIRVAIEKKIGFFNKAFTINFYENKTWDEVKTKHLFIKILTLNVNK